MTQKSERAWILLDPLMLRYISRYKLIRYGCATVAYDSPCQFTLDTIIWPELQSASRSCNGAIAVFAKQTQAWIEPECVDAKSLQSKILRGIHREQFTSALRCRIFRIQ